MNAKHTPGPWKADHLGVITGGSHFLTSVAETYATKWAHCQATSAHKHSQDAADYCGEMYEEAQANSRLIAAAPDLLVALRNLLEYSNTYSDIMARDFGQGAIELGDNADSVSVAGMARAAIAKAIGETT
jgi:hypothetical protein